MADFVAVIRKAVDGLANNTPENRAKVYDKARSAVVRQLENMKPRPPEELLKRQILKLDTAIAEVEGEYSEALPAAEEEQAYVAPVATPVAPDTTSPYYEEEVARDQHAQQDEAVAPEPVYNAPVEEERTPHYAAYSEEPAAEERYAEPEPEYVAPAPEAQTYFTRAEEDHRHPADAYEPIATTEPEPVAAEEEHAHEHWGGQDTPAEQAWAHEADEPVSEDLHAEPVEHVNDDVFHENTPLPYAASYAAPSPYYQDVNPDAAHAEQRSEEVHFGEAPQFDAEPDHIPEQKTEMHRPSPAVVEDYSTYFEDTALDLPAKTSPALPRADNDPFAPQTGQKDDKERTPWDDLEELIGYDGASGTSSSSGGRSDFDSGLAADGIPAAAYRTKKKPRRNYARLALSLCGVVLLAGGAYAMWVNRSALNDMVGGLVQSAQTGNTTTTPTETASHTTTTPATTTPVKPGANGQQPTTPTQTAAVDDGSVTGTKFTQRLLTDGTEKDEGAGPGTNGQPATAEGQSVYVQNEEAPAAPGQTTPAGTAAPAGQTPAAKQPAAAAGHRMFLYEEVLGQTVPTAIEGSVSWSLQNEPDANGKPSATVQGQITIPGRGLSALITFKRNTDPSLPASHLVEIVFSVGAGFEGGAIDSVQRIAMKSTEQDRGNALIAVPAKITDDFHMIALNDFPDALKTNLELMRSRDWIDIPVSYRNGRRALLTLQKGADGKAAFETALREWSAAVPATGQ